MNLDYLFARHRQWERENFSPEYETDEPEYYPDPDEYYDEKDVDK